MRKYLILILSFFSLLSFSQINENEKKTFTVNGISFTMIPVKAGTFIMGTDAHQKGFAHKVTLTTDYYMGETVVTQELYEAVMGKIEAEYDVDGFMWGPSYPAYTSFVDPAPFLSRLNAMTSQEFRLPTEAEWEYAARGGNKSKGYKFAGSDDWREVAWFEENSKGSTKPVKLKKPNELGLYDMSGNVWEMCQDWYRYAYFLNSPSIDPKGPVWGFDRLLRGGDIFCSASGDTKSIDGVNDIFSREGDYSEWGEHVVGFRLVMSCPIK